jgi:hypothetical protein
VAPPRPERGAAPAAAGVAPPAGPRLALEETDDQGVGIGRIRCPLSE